MTTQEKCLIDLLQAKYREDPKGFRKYLPGAAELLPEQPPTRSRARATFGLTERRAFLPSGRAVRSAAQDRRWNGHGR